MIEDCGIVIDLKVPPRTHTKNIEEQVSLMSRSEKENKENIFTVLYLGLIGCVYIIMTLPKDMGVLRCLCK